MLFPSSDVRHVFNSTILQHLKDYTKYHKENVQLQSASNVEKGTANESRNIMVIDMLISTRLRLWKNPYILTLKDLTSVSIDFYQKFNTLSLQENMLNIH